MVIVWSTIHLDLYTPCTLIYYLLIPLRKNYEQIVEEEGYLRIAEPENKYALCFTRDDFTRMVNEQYKTGRPSIRLMDQTIAVFHAGMKFNKFSPFFEAFNEKIGRMVSSGLIKVNSLVYSNEKIHTYVPEIGPQVLTLDQLRFGFLIIIACLVLSIVVFILEIIRARYIYC